MKYIAYGSNMVAEQMKNRCPDARLIGMGHVDRARLQFYRHATVEYTRRDADCVPVAVWEISAEDERTLDMYEGVPLYYVKREWTVRMSDGSQIKGMIYLMKHIRQYPPTTDYYNSIHDAYVELGIGSEIKTVLEPALQRSLKRNGSQQ